MGNRRRRIWRIDILRSSVGGPKFADKSPIAGFKKAIKTSHHGRPIQIDINLRIEVTNRKFSERLGARVFKHIGLSMVLSDHGCAWVEDRCRLVNHPLTRRAINHNGTCMPKIRYALGLGRCEKYSCRLDIDPVHAREITQLSSK